MISRSDGKNYHLLLADWPRPFPLERGAGRTDKVSTCFWYAVMSNAHKTRSAVVILPKSLPKAPNLFRRIEFAADLLAMELANNGPLDNMYEMRNDSLFVMHQ